METLLLEDAEGVAWLTVNRPLVLSAFDCTRQDERAAGRDLADLSIRTSREVLNASRDRFSSGARGEWRVR